MFDLVEGCCDKYGGMQKTKATFIVLAPVVSSDANAMFLFSCTSVSFVFTKHV